MLAVAVPPDGVFGQSHRRRCVCPWGCGRYERRSRRRTRRPATSAPSPLRMACSTRMLSGRFQWTPARFLKAEFVGAVSAVPYTRFLHPSLRSLLALAVVGPNLARRERPSPLSIPSLSPPPAGRATLYETRRLMPRPQASAILTDNNRVFRRCSAAKAASRVHADSLNEARLTTRRACAAKSTTILRNSWAVVTRCGNSSRSAGRRWRGRALPGRSR